MGTDDDDNNKIVITKFTVSHFQFHMILGVYICEWFCVCAWKWKLYRRRIACLYTRNIQNTLEYWIVGRLRTIFVWIEWDILFYSVLRVSEIMWAALHVESKVICHFGRIGILGIQCEKKDRCACLPIHFDGFVPKRMKEALNIKMHMWWKCKNIFTFLWAAIFILYTYINCVYLRFLFFFVPAYRPTDTDINAYAVRFFFFLLFIHLCDTCFMRTHMEILRRALPRYLPRHFCRCIVYREHNFAFRTGGERWTYRGREKQRQN